MAVWVGRREPPIRRRLRMLDRIASLQCHVLARVDGIVKRDSSVPNSRWEEVARRAGSWAGPWFVTFARPVVGKSSGIVDWYRAPPG